MSASAETKGGIAPSGRPLRQSILLGILTALVVLAIGLVFAFSRPVHYTAKASLVVLPSKQMDAATAAGYYETLSRGQIVATFAELLRLQQLEKAVAKRLKLSEAEREQQEVVIEVVPSTTMINLTVTGPDAQRAEAMAAGLTSEAGRFFRQLASPYTADLVSSAEGSAERTDAPDRTLVLAVVAAVALVSGIAAQQASQHIAAAMAFERAGASAGVAGRSRELIGSAGGRR